jgi:hypothetical protein
MHNMKWTTIVQMRHKIVYQDGTVQYTDIVYLCTARNNFCKMAGIGTFHGSRMPRYS